MSGFTWAFFVQYDSGGGGGEMCTVGLDWMLKASDEDGEAEEKEPTLP